MNQQLNCVLLIDDDEPTNFLNRMVLEEAECAARVVAVQRGEAALTFLQEEGWPDLILLDLNMPGMDGWEFLEAYRSLARISGCQTFIIILTTSINPDDEERAMDIAEVDGFRHKPLTPELMEEILREHFPREVRSSKGTKQDRFA